MGRDYLEIGPSPADEDCAQVGDPDYSERARPECQRFIECIRKALGPEPEGAQLAIKASTHDFGTYHEVICYFDTGNDAATEYAFKVEAESPTTWD